MMPRPSSHGILLLSLFHPSDSSLSLCWSAPDCVDRLRSHPKDAKAWGELGFYGGGIIGSRHFSPKDCELRALELDATVAAFWYNLGVIGGGRTEGRWYSEKACFQKALGLDPKDANAWDELGAVGGGRVKGRDHSPRNCFEKALKIDPHHAGAWYNLGLRGGGLVRGLGYSTPAQCYAKASEGRDRKLEVDLDSLSDAVKQEDFRNVAAELLLGNSKLDFREQMTELFRLCHPATAECLENGKAQTAYWHGELARKLPEAPSMVSAIVLQGVILELQKPQRGNTSFSRSLLSQAVCMAQVRWARSERRLATDKAPEASGDPCDETEPMRLWSTEPAVNPRGGHMMGCALAAGTILAASVSLVFILHRRAKLESYQPLPQTDWEFLHTEGAGPGGARAGAVQEVRELPDHLLHPLQRFHTFQCFPGV
ncbi:CYC8 [Symbiodinium sp. CCMP2592]|nr:CYC8 [Symbiodinium sp. CCMP2592]